MIICVVVGVAVATASYVTHLRHVADFTKSISYAHFMAKALEVYVSDHHEYPETLGAITQSDQTWVLPHPPFGASVIYHRPSTNAADTTPILIVTYRGREIVVRKDFTRTP
jgi:hypothetical protein